MRSARALAKSFSFSLTLFLVGALVAPTSALANDPTSAPQSPSPTASPSPSPQSYQQQLDAYKVKLEEYKVALEKWNALRKSAEDAFRIEMDKFKVARDAWDEKNEEFIEEIDSEFKKEINKARTDFRTSLCCS